MADQGIEKAPNENFGLVGGFETHRPDNCAFRIAQPFEDFALVAHAVRSQFVRSIIAIAFDNSSRAALSAAA
jgi:hypothetical protein